MPGAGKDYGIVWMPQVNDEVLVAFEQATSAMPYVLGGLWNGVDTIPFDTSKDLDAGKVIPARFISRTKHKITFCESSQDGVDRARRPRAARSTITLDEQNKVFKVAVTGGKVQIRGRRPTSRSRRAADEARGHGPDDDQGRDRRDQLTEGADPWDSPS